MLQSLSSEIKFNSNLGKQANAAQKGPSKVFMNSCRENECKDAPDISKHCTLTEPVQHSNGGATVCATNLVHSVVVLV